MLLSLFVRHALLWSWGPRIESKIAYCAQSLVAPTLDWLVPDRLATDISCALRRRSGGEQLKVRRESIGESRVPTFLADNETYLPHINI